MFKRFLLSIIWLGLFLCGCSENNREQNQTPTHQKPRNPVLRLAITTSTHDTGLMDALVPIFEKQHAARVDVIALGTGRAMKLGENGDVDVLLVHAREAEDQFMAAGHGVRREGVMYNTFEILGPAADPAKIKGMPAVEALQQIAAGEHRFVSRGDDSGTHKRELALWIKGSGLPTWQGYIESGQGMGATLIIADQMQAYTLVDHGTYLAFKNKIELRPLTASGKELLNRYSIITVNPAKNDQINHELADVFVDFIISPDTQRIIRDFKIAGEQLFYPLRLTDRSEEGSADSAD